MSSPQLLTIEILSWEKHNPKRDQKTYTWLRLNNDIISDPDLFGLTPEQKLVFIEILCQASRRNSGLLTINLGQLSHVTGVPLSAIKGLIQHLQQKPIISIHDNARSHDVVATTPTNERTNITNERTPATTAPRSRLVFDFESVYKIYPRKLGKAEGIARLTKMITTQEQFDALLKAVKNYAEACRVKGTEEKYIRHFDTFVGPIQKPAWTDFVDYNPKTGTAPKRDYSYLQE